MSISYFRRRAAASLRNARASRGSHKDYEALVGLGREFKARAAVARVRLARMRDAALVTREAERQGMYWDSRSRFPVHTASMAHAATPPPDTRMRF